MLFEDDQELRKLKRASEIDPEAKKRYVVAMMRAGRSGEVLSPIKQTTQFRDRSSSDFHNQFMRNFARSGKIHPSHIVSDDPDYENKKRKWTRQHLIIDRLQNRANADIARSRGEKDIEIPLRRAIKLRRSVSAHLRKLPSGHETWKGDDRLNRLKTLATRAEFQAMDRGTAAGRKAVPDKRGTAFKNLVKDWKITGVEPSLKNPKWKKL